MAANSNIRAEVVNVRYSSAIKNNSGVCRIAIAWRAGNSINKQSVEIVVARQCIRCL